MDLPLLETRRGHSHNMREIPPSVVAIAIDVHPHKPPALTVEISRPVKLTATPKLITKFSEFGDSILKSIDSRHGMEPLSNQESMTNNVSQYKPETHASTDAADATGNSLQVKVKVMQVLVEFQISTCSVDPGDGASDREIQPAGGAVPVAEEGFLLAWDLLDLAYPNVSSKTFILLYHFFITFSFFSQVQL